MSTLQVTVPVPVSGDGPLVDVSALVGPKTIQLTGYFSDYYDLLASQDDAEFVAVASFAAGGTASIEQTVSGSFKSFRVRANARPTSTVTCTASGESGAGQNYFASLTLGVAVDTWALFPPTGLEEDVCFICRGAFRGTVIVSGSPDGLAWNPIGSFRADRLPEGSPSTLDFSPLSSPDKVRYVKAELAGTATGAVVVTMGGRIPAGSGPSTLSNVSIQTSLLDGNIFYQGTPATDSPVVDARHNTVTPGPFSGDDCLCLGEYNTVSFSANPVSGPDVVAGVGNALAGNFLSVFGCGNSLGHESLSVVMTGDDNSSGASVSFTEVVGSENVLGDTISYAAIFGSRNTVGSGTDESLVTGSRNALAAGANRSVVSGFHVTVSSGVPGVSAAFCIASGSQISVGLLSADTVAVGHTITVGQQTSGVVALGDQLTVGNSLQNVVVVGRGATAPSSNSFVAGSSLSGPFHTFAVRGNSGGALDTIRAVDAPADGETGLTVVCNASGTYSNKTLKAAATPPVGALLAYVDP